MRQKLFILSISLLLISTGNAQQKEDVKKDSSHMYRKIEDLSKRNKISKFIYQLLFRSLPSNEPAAPVSNVKKQLLREQHYSRFEGKPIRNIEVQSFDPFGYDNKDTSRVPRSILEKSGNALHVRSMHRTIKKLLLIKKYDLFDSLRVRDSERLIRSQGFVHEVIFSPSLAGENSDSVDIFIRVYDLWCIIINGQLSKSSFSVDVKDKSFLGTGHQFQNVYGKNYTTGAENYRGNYHVPNIYNTYISGSLHLHIDNSNSYNRSININRPFFSAFTKWAGGAYYLQQFHTGILYNPDSTSFDQKYRSATQEYWTGKAWKLFKGSSEKARITNLIASVLLLNVHYYEKPSAYFDSLNTYSNETFYLSGIGISKRRYEQDRYIFKYGSIEDVSVGKAYSLVNGYQIKNNTGRYYLGARMYWGEYYSCGYISSNLEYGTFFHNSRKEEGTLTAGINYFTNIFSIGKWRVRQFVKPQCTIGFDRLSHDNLSINNELGIRGFNSSGLSGNSQKLVLTLQTQSYAPWNVMGFRFGPYIIASFAMLGTGSSGFARSPVYSQYGIGLLIRNEYLVQHSLQISIAFYPTIPGNGNNIFKINPVKTSDFGFRDFDIGKPAAIVYQ